MSVPPTPDRLSAILARFDLRARVFHTGSLCGMASFDPAGHVGHLHLLRSGRLRVTHGQGEEQHFDRPCLLYFAGRAPHQLLTAPDDPVDLLCASVDFGAGVGNPLVASLPDMLAIDLERLPGLAALLDLLFAEAFAQYCGRQAALDRLSELLILHLLRHVMTEQRVEGGSLAGLADPKLLHALVAIHEEPARPWSLAELASRCGMSRARFAAHFRAVVGSTPGDYLADWRVALAMRLLRQGRPAKSVALDVGYANASALARVFGARVGHSPKAWLAQAEAA